MTTTQKRELLIAKYMESDDILLVKYKGYTAKIILDISDSEFGNFIADAINEKMERQWVLHTTLPDEGENVGSKIVVGSKVKVCGRLITIITRIENDKYYFKDEEGREWQENISALELI